jgi:hypothetical protein
MRRQRRRENPIQKAESVAAARPLPFHKQTDIKAGVAIGILDFVHMNITYLGPVQYGSGWAMS